MEDELFREPALEHARRRLPGAVVIASPLSVKILVLVSLLAIGIVSAMLLLAGYSRHVSARGWLVPPEGIVSIRSPAAGQVASLSVAEGDHARADAELMRLRLQPGGAASTQAASSALLRERVSILSARSGHEQDRLESEIAAVGHEIASVRSSQAYLRRRIDLQTQQIQASEREIERLQPVADQGYLPLRELDARHSALLGLRAGLATLQSELATSEIRIREIRSRQEALIRSIAVARDDARLETSVLYGALVDEGGQAERVISLAKPGVIAAIHVRPGQSVAAGDPLLSASQGTLGEVRAEVFLPAAAAQRVRVGQRAQVWLDSQSRHRSKPLAGSVSFVAALPTNASNLDVPGVAETGPLYLVVITLDARQASTAPKLEPGMLLSADIRGFRTPIIGMFTPGGGE